MEEVAQKIQNMKRKSMKLSQEAKELMKDAKGEQKRIRTRGLCVMGNKLLSYLGVRDIEAHQKVFESICGDKKKADDIFLAAIQKFIETYNESLKNKQPSAQEDRLFS